MKKQLSLLVAGAFLLASCSDNETFDAPQVNAPAVQTVLVSESADLTFSFKADAGFKSATVSSSNGTAQITTNGVEGAKEGNIIVRFTAANTAGAGSVQLTITDKENKTAQATAVLNVVVEQIVFNVEGQITTNTTWRTGKVYILKNRVTVVSGVTLTIEPGVVVKGEYGTGANASALLIARGARIMAEGTAEQPIIFTSIADEIMPGQIQSPNLEPTINGLWGGVLILGNAPISASAASVQIEGIPASDPNGLYGGDNPNDNSGVLRYVSIRHGGANIGEGNEINGLTLGGVGRGTVVEFVEVVSNQDDGIEIFGGTVNVNNVLIWNVADDGIDTDQGWAGTLDNFIVICGSETDHALEIDGPEGSLMAGHTVRNGSVKGHRASELGDFRAGARGHFENIYFFGFINPVNCDGRGDLSLSGQLTLDNFAAGILTFANLQITLDPGTELSRVFQHGTVNHATEVAAGANTVGAAKSNFLNWSWAGANGQLADF